MKEKNHTKPGGPSYPTDPFLAGSDDNPCLEPDECKIIGSLKPDERKVIGPQGAHIPTPREWRCDPDDACDGLVLGPDDVPGPGLKPEERKVIGPVKDGDSVPDTLRYPTRPGPIEPLIDPNLGPVNVIGPKRDILGVRLVCRRSRGL